MLESVINILSSPAFADNVLASFSPLTVSCFILLVGLLVDQIFGDSKFIWRYVAHPVIWFGKQISWLDRYWNRRCYSGKKRRCLGGLALCLWSLSAGLTGYILSLPGGIFGLIIEVICVIILLAGNSLKTHVANVAGPLSIGDISQARAALSLIVGRQTNKLTESEVAGAAIETAAENLSDGVFAPAFWYLIGGLPGLFLYKFANTADSMIGYKNSHYLAFGTAAARFDDLMNIIPARLTGLIICGVYPGRGMIRAARIMFRDAGHHLSPNAGWPESAMAGLLDIQLGGRRTYNGRMVEVASLNNMGRKKLKAEDITDSIEVMRRSVIMVSLLLAGLMGASL